MFTQACTPSKPVSSRVLCAAQQYPPDEDPTTAAAVLDPAAGRAGGCRAGGLAVDGPADVALVLARPEHARESGGRRAFRRDRGRARQRVGAAPAIAVRPLRARRAA